MKKIFLLFSASVILYSCGSGDETKPDSADSTIVKEPAPVPEPATQEVSDNPDYIKGLELVAKYDCLTCHKVEEKAIGPSYREVANKYASDEQTINMLADKILKGGSGVWGQVPMTPHPTVPAEEAKQMVKYILLLKK